MSVGKEQFETVGDGLLVRAPAKINISLLIAGRRPDGFHEIETVMAKVNFYDQILIESTAKAGIELLCKGPEWAPEGEENLAYKAAKMLLDSYCAKANIKITLTKNIPAGSGLGSASSDAAAVLLGLNRHLQLKADSRRLSEMAAALGSDVSFFLGGPLAFCTGKGEKIKRLEKKFNFSALLLLPNVTVSTKKVYANYKHDSALYNKLNTQINALLEKNRIDLVSEMCANMLQTTCFSLYRELYGLKAQVESLGIRLLCLSGSGSATFCIFGKRDEKRISEYQHKLEEEVSCKSTIVSNNRW